MHENDADTLSIYRFDQEAAGDYAAIADSSGNGFNLTVNGDLEIVAGPDKKGRARFTLGTDYASHASSEAIRSVFVDEWTFEGWVYFDDVTRSQYLFNYGASGETEATNWIASLRTETNGELTVFQEQGSGSNITINSTAIPPEKTWCHVAVSKEFNGSDYTYRFYIDGVLEDTQTGATSTGGSSGQFYFLRAQNGNDFDGAIGSCRFSSVARTGPEIAASEARANKDHAVDGDTLMLYAMSELPDLLDENNVAHLRLTAGTNRIVDGLVSLGGSARMFDGSTKFEAANGYAPGGADFLAAILDEFTVEFWGDLEYNWQSQASCGAWVFGDPGSESADYNFVSFDVTAAAKGEVFSEYGSGTDSIYTSTADVLDSRGLWTPHHYAVTKRPDGGNVLYELYVDGELVEESDGSHLPFDGGALSFLQIGQGRATSSSRYWEGIIDDLRISTTRRSAAEILASYQAGIGGAEPAPDPGPPVLSALDSEDGGIGFQLRTARARG